MDAIYYCGGHGFFRVNVGASRINPKKSAEIIIKNSIDEELTLADLSDDQLRLIGNTIAVYLAEKEGARNYDDKK